MRCTEVWSSADEKWVPLAPMPLPATGLSPETTLLLARIAYDRAFALLTEARLADVDVGFAKYTQLRTAEVAAGARLNEREEQFSESKTLITEIVVFLRLQLVDVAVPQSTVKTLARPADDKSPPGHRISTVPLRPTGPPRPSVAPQGVGRVLMAA